MDERILKFILQNNVLTIAMYDKNDEVYIANAFYVYDENNFSFIIASSKNSKHVKLSFLNSNVALSIYKCMDIASLQGLQIKAKFSKANKKQIKMYYSKYPFAKFSINNGIFSLNIKWLKFTDNKLLLSKKLEFYR